MRDLIWIYAVELLPRCTGMINLIKIAGIEEVLLFGHSVLLIDKGGGSGIPGHGRGGYERAAAVNESNFT